MYPHDTDPFDRLPPHDLDAERCVLASLMLDKDLIPELRPLLRPGSFYQPDHDIVYAAVLAVYDRAGVVDVVLVREHLDRRGLLDEIGGTATLAAILDAVPAATHGPQYARIVAEKFRLRELIRTFTDGLRRCYGKSGEDAEAVVVAAEAGLQAVRETGHADTIRTIGQCVQDLLGRKRRGDLERVPTGITTLDELVGGIPAGLFTLVAAKPGMGKSMLVKQVVRNVAGRGTPCGIITIEENWAKIATNYLAGESGVKNQRIAYNTLVEQEWREIEAAAPALAKLPVFIDDAQNQLSAIERTARRMVKKYGCRLLVVDHLHLVDGEIQANRTQEVTKISNGLKALFKDLGVAGIAVAQMNRQSGDPTALPELWHLRESGTLEADGDLIIQLHRDDYYRWKADPENYQPDHKLVAFVNKNKDGNIGAATLYFDGDGQRVLDWEARPVNGAKSAYAGGVGGTL